MSAGAETASARAPASVGNVGVGFDVLGHALVALWDRVVVRRIAGTTVRIDGIAGIEVNLPQDPSKNAATAPLIQMRDELGLSHGFAVEIEKGIPLGSGMGGSAASAVAAVAAANLILPRPLRADELLKFALEGERAASGSTHADNAAPSLLGGLVLLAPGPALRPLSIPVPPGLRCVLVHPHFELETRRAREVLRDVFPLERVVNHSARLATLIAACYRGDPELMRGALEDHIVEPQRAGLIPGFRAVQQAAFAAGAVGCSISGGGPSVFAWCRETGAKQIGESMQAVFRDAGLDSDYWVSAIDAPGAVAEVVQ